MKKLFIVGLLLFSIYRLSAQEISLEKGWKFSTGDSAIWASPTPAAPAFTAYICGQKIYIVGC